MLSDTAPLALSLNIRTRHINGPQLDGMHKREEVTTIKLNRRLLLTAAVGAVLVISAALIVSMPGNDKPRITDNPPADNEEPQDTQTAPVVKPSDVSDSDDDQDDDAQTEPEDPDDNDDDQGDDDDNPPSDNEKARGLARALQVHERNMEKRVDKGKDIPKGLEMSFNKLTAKYQAQQEADLGDHADDGQDKDKGQGDDHSNNGDNGKHNGKGQSGVT